jgi:hypothetical protein
MGAGLVQPAAIREGKQTMVSRENVKCEQVWREISNYLDGDVDASLRSAMEEHFQTCEKCASVLTGTQNVVRLYGDERMLEVPAGFSRRLEKRIEQGQAHSLGESRQWWSSWSAWLIPVAALLVIAGGVKLTNSVGPRIFVRSQHAEPAKDIPPNLQVVVSDGEKLFHVPGCKFIKDPNSERKMTAQEAIKEGYVPCPRCLRQYLKTDLIGHPQTLADDDGDVERNEPLNFGSVTK